MHLPMICDRYELRDDVMPGAGRSRGGIGVVKAQRVLTDAFITHENERHHDVPWGVFGGSTGAVGKVDIYNVARPAEVKHMPAKFSGLRVAAGDVHVFYGPCGGGFGDPLERPAEKVLDDVLDGFCTVEHARAAYGVVLDPVAETVDEAATRALRERMRSSPQPRAAAAEERPAAPRPPTTPARSPAPARPVAASRPPVAPAQSVAGRERGALAEVLRGLREAHGDGWSFEIVRHSAYGNTIEVVGQLRANGSTVRETAVAASGQGRSLGELLERAANDSLQKCAETLLRNGR
jgi:hypothetical protein